MNYNVLNKDEIKLLDEAKLLMSRAPTRYCKSTDCSECDATVSWICADRSSLTKITDRYNEHFDKWLYSD